MSILDIMKRGKSMLFRVPVLFRTVFRLEVFLRCMELQKNTVDIGCY